MQGSALVAPPVRTGTAPHCVEFREGKRHEVITDLDDISERLKSSDNLIWLDLVSPSSGELEVLRREFDLHPLAIEDAQTAHERPKIEAYPNYVFLIVHPATWKDERLIIHEMAIFAGPRYLVTIHHEPAYPLAEAERRWHLHDGELGADVGILLYTLLDTIVDGYFPISDRLEEWISELQNGLFDARSDQNKTLRDIFELKNDVHHARRAIVPMRDILQPLLRGDLKLFDRDDLPFYRDVYDHAIRVIDQLDSARDFINSALEIHLSLVANRQNEVAKQLAIIATVFLPLTYITGFFGQNFGFMVNGITTPQTFWLIGVGTQVVGLVALLGYFKIKRWF
jgi:magnesium transporter